MKTRPYEYQKQVATQIERFNGRALLTLSPGLGKTLCSLLYAKRNHDARPIVVVCPASVKWGWQREAALHFGMSVEVLEGTKPYMGEQILQPSILALNYDILYAWLDYLKALKPKLVILDECHFLTDIRARRTKVAKKLCQGVPHVLALSGTPLTNKPADLFPILNILRPEVFPRFIPFADDFSNPTMKPWGMDYSGASNLNKLHRILTKTCMIRLTKEEVLDQLPEKQTIVVPMEIKGREEYDLAVSDFLGWLMKESPAKAHRAMQAEKLTKFGYLKRLVAKLKLLSVFEWVDNFLKESNEKLVLFGIHKEVISALKARYPKISVVVDGSVRGHKRQLAIDQFVNCKWSRLFIGNIRSTGLGINGLTVANTVAFAELEWSPAVMSQAIDRVYARMGNLHGANIYFLIAHNTIETKVAKILQRKQGILDATLDGQEHSSEMAIYDLVEEELLKHKKKVKV